MDFLGETIKKEMGQLSRRGKVVCFKERAPKRGSFFVDKENKIVYHSKIVRRKTLAQKDRESEANIERCSTAGISEDVVWEPICEALSTTVAAHNTDETRKGKT